MVPTVLAAGRVFPERRVLRSAWIASNEQGIDKENSASGNYMRLFVDGRMPQEPGTPCPHAPARVCSSTLSTAAGAGSGNLA